MRDVFRRHPTILIFAACTLAVFGALAWVTRHALSLEREQQEARAHAAVQERLRLALWRMDSKAGAIMAREAARPYFEYQTFYPTDRAYRGDLSEVSAGEVLVASPLLTLRDRLVRVYFEVGADGEVRSPQAPTGPLRMLAESAYAGQVDVASAEERLRELSPLLRNAVGRELAGVKPWLAGEAGLEADRAKKAGLAESTKLQEVEGAKSEGVETFAGRTASVGARGSAEVDRAEVAHADEQIEQVSSVPKAPASAPAPAAQVEEWAPATQQRASMEPELQSTNEYLARLAADLAVKESAKRMADNVQRGPQRSQAPSDPASKAMSGLAAGSAPEAEAGMSAPAGAELKDASADEAGEAQVAATGAPAAEVADDRALAEVSKREDKGPETVDARRGKDQAGGDSAPPTSVGPAAPTSAPRPSSPSRQERGGRGRSEPAAAGTPARDAAPPAPAKGSVEERAREFHDQVLLSQKRMHEETRAEEGGRTRVLSEGGAAAGDAAGEVEVGEFAAEWIVIEDGRASRTIAVGERGGASGRDEMGGGASAGEGGVELLCVRNVDSPSGRLVQGFWLDWPALRVELLESIKDLFPSADVRAVSASVNLSALTTDLGRRMASIPAELVPGQVPLAVVGGWTPLHNTLLLAWIGVLLAIGAIAAILRAATELAERRGRFVSAVTHELRTPLTTFVMYSQMLAEGMVPEGEAKQGYYATLKRESTRLAGIVENVLEYAKLSRRQDAGTAAKGAGGLSGSGGASGIAHRRERIELSELVARVAGPLRTRVERAEMALVVEIEGDADASVEIDETTLERILVNLVDNACKYGARRTGDGGGAGLKVEGGCGTVTLRVTVRGGDVVFAVSDDGPGIEEADRSRIFKAFERGKRQADGSIPGIGLGLALSKGMAKDLGGDLTLVRARPATFEVRVPRG